MFSSTLRYSFSLPFQSWRTSIVCLSLKLWNIVICFLFPFSKPDWLNGWKMRLSLIHFALVIILTCLTMGQEWIQNMHKYPASRRDFLDLFSLFNFPHFWNERQKLFPVVVTFRLPFNLPSLRTDFWTHKYLQATEIEEENYFLRALLLDKSYTYSGAIWNNHDTTTRTTMCGWDFREERRAKERNGISFLTKVLQVSCLKN